MSSDVYRLAADGVLTIHFLFVFFVVGGLVVIYLGKWLNWGWVRSPVFRVLHVAAIGLVVAQAWAGVVCPLTTWEAQLRAKAGQEHYGAGFIEYWLSRLLFFEAPTWVFLLAYTIFGTLVVASWWVVRPRPFRRRR